MQWNKILNHKFKLIVNRRGFFLKRLQCLSNSKHATDIFHIKRRDRRAFFQFLRPHFLTNCHTPSGVIDFRQDQYHKLKQHLNQTCLHTANSVDFQIENLRAGAHLKYEKNHWQFFLDIFLNVNLGSVTLCKRAQQHMPKSPNMSYFKRNCLRKNMTCIFVPLLKGLNLIWECHHAKVNLNFLPKRYIYRQSAIQFLVSILFKNSGGGGNKRDSIIFQTN